MEIALGATTASRVRNGATVLVPLGSIGQHDSCLPLDTDTELAVAVAEAAAKLLRRRRIDVVVAPAVAYGAPGPHPPSDGSLTTSTPVLQALLVDLARSARSWAERVVFLTGHDGNVGAVERAVAQLRSEGVLASSAVRLLENPAAPADNRMKTSVMLHLRPWRFRSGRDRAASSEEGRELLDLVAWHVAQEILGSHGVGTPL